MHFVMGLFSYLWVAVAVAQTTVTPITATADVKASSNNLNKPKMERKKLGVDQSDFMPKANNYGAVIYYGGRYDDLQQTTEKTVLHSLGISATYSFTDRLSSFLSVGFDHETNKNKIVRDNDQNDYHQMSDISLGMIYNIRKPTPYLLMNSTTLTLSLPTSERSQYDKTLFDLTLSNYLESNQWNRVSLFYRLTGDYLSNRLRFSVYEGDTLNRDWNFSNIIGLNYLILPGLGVRVSFVTQNTRFLDNSWDMTFGNRISMYGNLFGFQISAGMLNNAYPENDRLLVDYYDKYRRLYSVGIAYAF